MRALVLALSACGLWSCCIPAHAVGDGRLKLDPLVTIELVSKKQQACGQLDDESSVIEIRRKIEQARDEAERAMHEIELARTYFRENEYEQALTVCDQALQKRLGDGAKRDLLRLRGRALTRLSRYPEALASLRASQKLCRPKEDVKPCVWAQANIAGVQELRGRYLEALEMYEAALSMLWESRGEIGLKAGLLTDIALVYAELGDHDRARDGFERSLNLQARMSQGKRSTRLRGRILHQSGVALSKANAHKEAVSRYQDAIPLRLSSCDLRGAAKTLNSLGFSLVKLEYCEHAMAYLKSALELNRKAGDRAGEAHTLDSIGIAHLCRGETDKALEYLNWALVLFQAEEVDNRGAQYETLVHIADVYQRRRETRIEIIYLKQSIYVLEKIRSDLGGLPIDLRSSFDRTVSGTYRRLIDLLLLENRENEALLVIELMQEEIAQEYLKVISMPAKDRSIVTLKEKKSDVDRIPLSESEQQVWKIWDEVRDRMSRILQKIEVSESLGVQEEQLECDGDDRSNACDAIVALRDNLLREKGEVTKEFAEFSRLPEVVEALSRESEDVDPANLSGLMKHLSQNTALIYTLLLPDRLELILLLKDRPPLRISPNRLISSERIVDDVQQFRQHLLQRSDDVLSSAQRLYDDLFRPVRDELDKHNIEMIIYVPDSVLRYVPFAALHDGSQWLAESYSSITATANSLKHLGRRPEELKNILAAATVIGGHHVQIGKSKAHLFQGLPGAGREIDNLAARFLGQVKLRRDEQFSKRLTLRFQDYQLVHLATHAVLVADSVEASFILLGDGSYISIADLDSWSLTGVELLVLSACETGIGGNPASAGSEIIGFGHRVQKQGAMSVLASLWKVSDASTQRLMAHFYRRLKAGDGKAEALRFAQECLLKGGCPSIFSEGNSTRSAFVVGTELGQSAFKNYQHPYYWAPFFIIGNGQ